MDDDKIHDDDTVIEYGDRSVRRRVLVALVLAVMLIAIAAAGVTFYFSLAQNAANNDDSNTIVILISVDALQWSYMTSGNMTEQRRNLDRLTSSGVRSAMQSIYPSSTFPNHYTIVTGLYPESHGIVSNTMYDPVLNATFSLSDSTQVRDGRWWLGEPIWVTAVKNGLKSACMFWPGSEAEIDGVRPTYYRQYSSSVPYSERVDQVLEWLNMDETQRPSIITVYFEGVDTAGHEHGPWGAEVYEAMSAVDDAIGTLLDGVEASSVAKQVHVVLVSDHGMAPIDPSRVVYLDDYIDLNNLERSWGSPNSMFYIKDGLEDEVLAQLQQMEHVSVYKKEDFPAQYHYYNSDRIANVIGVCDEGWTLTSHALAMERPTYLSGGAHGYIPDLLSMTATFVANGRSFKKGFESTSTVRNLDVYSLLTHLLGLPAAPNNGTLDNMKQFLV